MIVTVQTRSHCLDPIVSTSSKHLLVVGFYLENKTHRTWPSNDMR
jgi:hypothetical protein